ncbi:MAG: response regulator transcription factor [Candidatus Acidiferrales bacterium]
MSVFTTDAHVMYPMDVYGPEVALPCRILIADDHTPLRNMLKATLEAHAGWQVCAEAANGLEAVQKTAEFKPDIIILDLSMPVMNGLEATREILSVSPHVPILMFTNHALSHLAREAEKAGIRQIISKIYEGDELAIAVETLLNEKPRCAGATIQTEEIPKRASLADNEENQ